MAADSEGFSLDRAVPAAPGGSFFIAPSLTVPEDRLLTSRAVFSYAQDPLVLTSTDDDSTRGVVVSNLAILHIGAAFTPLARLALDLDVPLVLAAAGDSPTVGGQKFSSPSAGGFGDVKLGMRYSLIGKPNDALELGLSADLWLPSGDRDTFLGDGSAHGKIALLASGRSGSLVWSAGAGPELRPTAIYANTTQGTAISYAAALGLELGETRRVLIGPELFGSVVLEDAGSRSVQTELLVAGHYTVSDEVSVGFAVGPGIGAGIGTPSVRVLGLVSYAPAAPEDAPDADEDGIPDMVDGCPDKPGPATTDVTTNGCPRVEDVDGDGVPDEVDACPAVRGLANEDATKNGCPPPKDTDSDGIPDASDACPSSPGLPSELEKKNGCPPDRDNDGVADAVDACPDVRGVKQEDPKQNGCLEDSDRDGISDDQDACFDVPGVPNEDRMKNGCPKPHAALEQDEIKLDMNVEFEPGKAVLKASATAVLDDIADVLNDHPELLRVEVQGHTDKSGDAARNKALSNERAEVVKKALVSRGIDAKRLTARGYGSAVPVADESTPEGREKNRRVELKVLKRTP